MVGLRTGDVLLALAGDAGGGAVGGSRILAFLQAAGVGSARADRVLARLLELEAGGLVSVARNGGLAFSLTERGERAASELGGGRITSTSMVMVDLVGFVAFTERHGDAAAHESACALASCARAALAQSGGRIVKTLGDGVIGAAPPSADLVAVVRRIAGRVQQPDGSPWKIRAAIHVGSPIEHQGDLFGRDVNLLARLCDAAAPDELIRSAPGTATEQLAVRGLDDPVGVTRMVLR